MTVVSINQPAYLPWLGYFHRIAVSDVHVVLDHVQFEKNSFTNRNRIRLPSGPAWLTVPLRTKGSFGHLAIDQLRIAEDARWRARHLRSLEHAYGRTAGFAELRGELAAVYAHEWTHLLPLVSALTTLHLAHLAITTPVLRSSLVGAVGTKSDLVLDLCRRLGATTYLSGPHGRDYLELEAFADEGIDVRYHDYQHPVYQQTGAGFVSHLAAIDLLASAGPAAAAIARGDGPERA